MSNSDPVADDESPSDLRSCIDRILAADDVDTATDRFEQFLQDTDAEVKALDGEGNGHDRDKVVVDGESLLFLKTPRPKDEEVVIVDTFSELVIQEAAEHLKVPVLPASLIEYAGEPALVMRWLDEDLKEDRQDSQPKDFSNADELPLLYVFEVWVRNFDDTDEHFRIDTSGDSEEIKILDHGHALYRKRFQQIEEVDDLEEFPENVNVGDDPEMYGIGSFEDIQRAVEEIHHIPPERIEEFVDQALDQLRSIENPKVDEFLENEGLHRELAVQMLKERRGKITEYVRKHVS